MGLPLYKTSPLLSGVGKVQVVIQRPAPGAYVNGRWTEGQKTTLEIYANVQPGRMKYSEIISLPEADRTKETIKIYTTSEIRTLREGENAHQADLVEWDGKLFEIRMVRHYQMGVLDHYEAVGVRV